MKRLLFILFAAVSQFAFGTTAPSLVNIRDKPFVDAREFGAVGDGSTNNAVAFSSADSSAQQVVLASGVYKVSSDVTLSGKWVISKGASINVASGTQVTFKQQIDAGAYPIFTIPADYTNRLAKYGVRLFGHEYARPEWFGASSTTDITAIESCTDASPSIMKARRALEGNYIYRSPTTVIGENSTGDVLLSSGFYRCDASVLWGTSNGGKLCYVSGIGMRGNGPASSYLIRNDLTSNAIVLNITYGSSEKKTFRDFKISAYDSGPATFTSAAAAGVLVSSCDSVLLDNIWVSGMQANTASATDGVGIQFDSSIDTYCRDCFVEYCNFGMGIYSGYVTIVSPELYSCGYSGIVLGVPLAAYSRAQSAETLVSVFGGQVRGCPIGVYVIAADQILNMSDTLFSGIGESGTVGAYGAYIASGSLSGSIKGSVFSNFVYSLLEAEATGFAGSASGSALVFDSCVFRNQVGSRANASVINIKDTLSRGNLAIKSTQFIDCLHGLTYIQSIDNLLIENVTLRRNQGFQDTANQGFLIVLQGTVVVRGLVRPDTFPTISGLGFIATGVVNLSDVFVNGMTTASMTLGVGAAAYTPTMKSY